MNLEGKRREINNPCGLCAVGTNLRTGFVAAGVRPASLTGLPLLLTLWWWLSDSPQRPAPDPVLLLNSCGGERQARLCKGLTLLEIWGFLPECGGQPPTPPPQRHRMVYIKLSVALSLQTKLPHSPPPRPPADPAQLSWNDNEMSWSRFLKEIVWRTASTFCGKRLTFISQKVRGTPERVDPEGTGSLISPRTLENGRRMWTRDWYSLLWSTFLFSEPLKIKKAGWKQ